MSIGLRVALVASTLAACSVYVGYFVLMIRTGRTQAGVVLDRGRALERLPPEVRRDEQQVAFRRATVGAALFLGTIVVSGIVTMINHDPSALVVGPILCGFIVLTIPVLTSTTTMALDLGRRYLRTPDPGRMTVDLGIVKHGTALARNATIGGLIAFFVAIGALIQEHWPAAMIWGFIGLLTLSQGVAGAYHVQLTERGLWNPPRFWPWRRLVRRAWSDDGQCVALKWSAPILRYRWVIVPVAEGRRDEVEDTLRQYLPVVDGTSSSVKQ